jgi:hypothetical protein
VAISRAPAAALLFAVLAACAAGPPVVDLPLARIDPVLRLSLEAVGPGLARHLRVRVEVEAPGLGPLEVRGVRGTGEGPDAVLLDLELRTVDFPGDRPVSSGRTTRLLVPWGRGGVAAPGAPLVVVHEVALEPGEDGLARRVEAQGRLIGVDLIAAAAHSGGTILDLPTARLESFAAVPSGSLEAALQSGDGPGIFLAATAMPTEGRDELPGVLVGALAGLDRPAREAAFAALLYLTGETNGRDIYRWRSWWKQRERVATDR